MLRPPETTFRSERACPQCKGKLFTEYACYWKGPVTSETLVLRCTCGYSYTANGAYGHPLKETIG
jgi:hypothetical protein